MNQLQLITIGLISTHLFGISGCFSLPLRMAAEMSASLMVRGLVYTGLDAPDITSAVTPLGIDRSFLGNISG
jgi:hypothetical protein